MELLRDLALENTTLHDKEWLRVRVENIIKNSKKSHNSPLLGYKEPNTHVFAKRLLELQDDMKFVYVYRDGLDMAYSANQNQLKLWGKIVFDDYELEITPRNSLKYWLFTHRRMERLKALYPKRVYMLNFDRLCLCFDDELCAFLEFLDITPTSQQMLSAKGLVKVPHSIGRHRSESMGDFDESDVEFCRGIMR